MSLQLELRPAAVRALIRTGHQDPDRMGGAIALLCVDPRPPGTKALQERPGLRVHTGDYSIPCSVDENILVVAVIKLGHRSNVCEH